MSRINTTFQKFADYVFSFFDSPAVSRKDVDLFRKIETDARVQGKRQAEINLYHVVINNLLQNGYLEVAGGSTSCFRLTEKGRAYLQDGGLIKNKIDFRKYVGLDKEDVNEIFSILWSIIGPKDTAPFYVDGPTYFNAINPFVNVATSYTEYMDMLSGRKESTTRSIWYRSLFVRLEKSVIPSFLSDLSLMVYAYYDEKENQIQATVNLDEVLDFGAPKDKSNFLIEYTKVSDISASVVPKDNSKVPLVVFISYCWDCEEHKEWVRKLAKDLDEAGFEVKWDEKQRLGTELNYFMEQGIKKANKVLMIVTPEYKKKADSRKNGVGKEVSLIADYLMDNQNATKFIPVIRKGNRDTSFPMCLGNRKGLNMVNDDEYAQKLEELIEDIKRG